MDLLFPLLFGVGTTLLSDKVKTEMKFKKKGIDLTLVLKLERNPRRT